MTIQEFAKWVELMRRKQSEYFRTRGQSVLTECRDLERKVDESAKAILHPKATGLFDDIREVP